MGDDNMELDVNEYKKEVVRKKIRVRGDVYVTGCWDKKNGFNYMCIQYGLICYIEL